MICLMAVTILTPSAITTLPMELSLTLTKALIIVTIAYCVTTNQSTLKTLTATTSILKQTLISTQVKLTTDLATLTPCEISRTSSALPLMTFSLATKKTTSSKL